MEPDPNRSLAARLHHEARTPLNSILGMVELLEATSLDPEQRGYVSVLRRNVETLVSVVTGLPEPASDKGPSALAAPLRILIADDSQDNRDLIVRYLRNSNCLIDVAEDGAQALEKFKASSFDVVLMDIEMPVLDGFAATAAIRAWEAANGRAPARVLALTAHDPAETQAQSQAAGCDELLSKPLRKSTLLKALEPVSDIADLLPGYLARRRAEIPKLRTAAARADLETLRIAGHQMAGTGAGYGLPQVSGIGAALEEAAKTGDCAALGALIDSLEEAVRE